MVSLEPDMKLLTALDSRWANKAAVGLLDPHSGSWSSFEIVDLPEQFNRRGFRGMSVVDNQTIYVVNSAALYRLRLNVSDETKPLATVEQSIRRPEWEVGQRAGADLHHVLYVPARDVLLVANSAMDSVDEVSPEGKLLRRRYLWDLSSEIAELARERNPDASVHDLTHLNHITTHGDYTYLTAGNLNGTRVGCMIRLETGEIVLDGLHFPHDGVVLDGDLYVSNSGTSTVHVWRDVGNMDLRGRPPDEIVPIQIQQDAWSKSFQWVRGVARSHEHLVVGVTQWRISESESPQIPPRLVFFKSDGLTFEGEIFLPQVEGFPSPCIYSIHAIDDDRDEQIPAAIWERALLAPPPTEVIDHAQIPADQPGDLALLLNNARQRAQRLSDQLDAHRAQTSAERANYSKQVEKLRKKTREVARLNRQLRDANMSVREMRSTRWWRLGSAGHRLVRNPLALPSFVAELVRLIFRRRAHRTTTTADVAGRYCTVDIPEVPLPEGPQSRPDLTVAVILDTFSAAAFRYEWRQIEPKPDNWRTVLAADRPHLLFVESAWWGNDRRWAGAMSRPTSPSEPLRELVTWCKEQDIPTVFWNKEDPPNFERFIETAKLFDHVFTVDADCLPRYRQALGHDRVALLPFGAQPRIHNPVSVDGGRKYEVAFAGTYHAAKYPERQQQMQTILTPSIPFDLHIFSRMTGDPRYEFPLQFADRIVGSLPYERMLAAYKAYKVFLNVSSAAESETMCPRRVFELSACATPVVSGSSAALEKVFGELVAICRSPESTTAALTDLLYDDELRDRRGHLAMREVLTKHTYGHRVDAVLSKVGLLRPPPSRSISVILATNRPEKLNHAITQVAGQQHLPLQLVLVLHGFDNDDAERTAREAGLDNVVVRSADASLTLGACLNLGIDAADGDYIAKMDDDNLYGEHYLSDLVNAFAYTSSGVVGKGAHYVLLQSSGVTVLRFPHHEHAASDFVQGGSILADGEVLRRLRFSDLPRGVDTDLLRRVRHNEIGIYSADRFNFVSVRGQDPEGHTWKISDKELTRNALLTFLGSPEEHVMF